MPTRKFPCAISRWFKDGHGWALDRRLANSQGELFSALNDDLRASLSGQPDGLLIERPALGGWLVGHRHPDPNTPDTQAVHRSASIFRVAFIRSDTRPTPEVVSDVRKRLLEVVPTSPGVFDLNIEVFLPDPVILAPSSGQQRLTQCWGELAKVWQSAVYHNEYADTFVSKRFVAEPLDGKTISRDETLGVGRRPTGFVRDGRTRAVVIESGWCPTGVVRRGR